MVRALIICPTCEGHPVDYCPECEGAATLIIDEAEVKETDYVINGGLPDAAPTK